VAINVAKVKLPDSVWDFPPNRPDLAAAAAARAKAAGDPLDDDELVPLTRLNEGKFARLTELLKVVASSDDPVADLQEALDALD